jgi:branched-subunit amino acid transport protein
VVRHISLSSKYNDVISFVFYSIMLVLLVSHISLSSKYNDVISFVSYSIMLVLLVTSLYLDDRDMWLTRRTNMIL